VCALVVCARECGVCVRACVRCVCVSCVCVWCVWFFVCGVSVCVWVRVHACVFWLWKFCAFNSTSMDNLGRNQVKGQKVEGIGKDKQQKE